MLNSHSAINLTQFYHSALKGGSKLPSNIADNEINTAFSTITPERFHSIDSYHNKLSLLGVDLDGLHRESALRIIVDIPIFGRALKNQAFHISAIDSAFVGLDKDKIFKTINLFSKGLDNDINLFTSFLRKEVYNTIFNTTQSQVCRLDTHFTTVFHGIVSFLLCKIQSPDYVKYKSQIQKTLQALTKKVLKDINNHSLETISLILPTFTLLCGDSANGSVKYYNLLLSHVPKMRSDIKVFLLRSTVSDFFHLKPQLKRIIEVILELNSYEQRELLFNESLNKTVTQHNTSFLLADIMRSYTFKRSTDTLNTGIIFMLKDNPYISNEDIFNALFSANDLDTFFALPWSALKASGDDVWLLDTLKSCLYLQQTKVKLSFWVYHTSLADIPNEVIDFCFDSFEIISCKRILISNTFITNHKHLLERAFRLLGNELKELLVLRYNGYKGLTEVERRHSEQVIGRIFQSLASCDKSHYLVPLEDLVYDIQFKELFSGNVKNIYSTLHKFTKGEQLLASNLIARGKVTIDRENYQCISTTKQLKTHLSIFSQTPLELMAEATEKGNDKLAKLCLSAL